MDRILREEERWQSKKQEEEGKREGWKKRRLSLCSCVTLAGVQLVGGHAAGAYYYH